VIFLVARTINPIFPAQHKSSSEILGNKEGELIELWPIYIYFFFNYSNILFLLRTHGFGRMDLTGTMKTGHLISRMTVTVERTVFFYGESLANLVISVVQKNFLMSARYKEQNVIQKKQNKNEFYADISTAVFP
jgi:hypothetical protein